MTAPGQPMFDELMAALVGLSTKLAGREGSAIREHVQRLANVLALGGQDAVLRARAADELEQMAGTVAQVGEASRGSSARMIRDMNLGQLASGLRTLAEHLRAPAGASQAQVAELVAKLRDAAVLLPMPLDEPQLDGAIEELVVETARRHGLEGAELHQAVEHMKGQISALVRELQQRAKQDVSRSRTAAEFERLIGAVVQTGNALGAAVSRERTSIIQAFRSVDLVHMAEGLRVFAGWLSSSFDNSTSHVAELRAKLVAVLGPPTSGDPARSEAERRADLERQIRAAVDQILLSTKPAQS